MENGGIEIPAPKERGAPIKVEIKRARLTAPKTLDFEVLEVETDTLKEGEIYAETEFSAVSLGTETAAYVGLPPLRPGPIYPRKMGYCNVAIIRKTGSGVSLCKVGERILTNQSHQSAFICQAGDILGIVPSAIQSEVAALTYLAHLGLVALERASYQINEWAGILGLGPIGLCAVAVVNAMGGRVVAIGNSNARLAVANALGADLCLKNDDPGLQAKWVPVVVTTVNSWEGWRTAMELAAPWGRISVLGFPGRGEAAPKLNPFDSALFYDKQLSIFSAGQLDQAENKPSRLQSNIQKIFGWMSAGKLPLERLITHRVSWQSLDQIYQASFNKDKALIISVLNWNI